MTLVIMAKELALNKKSNREFGPQLLLLRVSLIMRRLNIVPMNWNCWQMFGPANIFVPICWVLVFKC